MRPIGAPRSAGPPVTASRPAADLALEAGGSDRATQDTSLGGGPARRAGLRKRWIAAGALVAVAIAIAVSQALRAEHDPLLSTDERPAPAFELPYLAGSGGTVALVDAEGPVVLNLWASWCVPCRREMPVLEAANRQFGEQITFLGINHLDQRTEALEFLASAGVTYPSAYDPSGTIAADYGAFGLPTTYFITGSRHIIATKTGELTPEELTEQIERLLGDGR